MTISGAATTRFFLWLHGNFWFATRRGIGAKTKLRWHGRSSRVLRNEGRARIGQERRKSPRMMHGTSGAGATRRPSKPSARLRALKATPPHHAARHASPSKPSAQARALNGLAAGPGQRASRSTRSRPPTNPDAILSADERSPKGPPTPRRPTGTRRGRGAMREQLEPRLNELHARVDRIGVRL